MTEFANLLGGWNFSGCFPAGYAGSQTVDIVVNFTSDLARNITAETNGMLSVPMISVMPMPSPEISPTLGRAAPGQGTPAAGKTRYSRALRATLLVACWADLQVGAGDMAQALAGQVWSACFQNENTLTAFRRLKCEPGHLVFNDAAQLWSNQMTVSGTVVSYFDA